MSFQFSKEISVTKPNRPWLIPKSKALEGARSLAAPSRVPSPPTVIARSQDGCAGLSFEVWKRCVPRLLAVSCSRQTAKPFCSSHSAIERTVSAACFDCGLPISKIRCKKFFISPSSLSWILES